MKHQILLRLLCIPILTGCIFAGCATTKRAGIGDRENNIEAAQKVNQQANGVEDAGITSAIKTKFANDDLVSGSNISVDTAQGIVTLNGTVASQAELDRAIQLGRSVTGVNIVRSRLTIKGESK